MKIDLKSKSKSIAIEWFQIKITNQKNDFKSWFQIIWFQILPNTATVSEIQRDISEKVVILSYPLAFDAPVRGFPSEYRPLLWDGKTRMVSLPDGKKIRRYLYSFWRDLRTWPADGQSDRRTLDDSKDRACIASRGKNVLWHQKLEQVFEFCLSALTQAHNRFATRLPMIQLARRNHGLLRIRQI